MSLFDQKAGWWKFLLGWVLCFGFRFLSKQIPSFPPNVEPVMATTMPFGRYYGALGGFLFAALTIVLFDASQNLLGTWTLVTALTYGAIGAASSLILGRFREHVFAYVAFAFVATIAYDLITGVFFGPVLFGGSFYDAFIGQIPFTINHLLGNLALAAVVSPLVSKWIVRNGEGKVWRSAIIAS